MTDNPSPYSLQREDIITCDSSYLFVIYWVGGVNKDYLPSVYCILVVIRRRAGPPCKRYPVIRMRLAHDKQL